MSLFLRAAYARAYPRFIGLGRQRSWLFMEIMLPLLGILSMGYVYKGLHAPQQFLGFVILGGAMLAFWQNVVWTMAAQMYWDRDGGNLELFVISPTSLIPILAGMAVGAIVSTTLRASVVVVAGSLLFGVQYNLASLPAAAGIFLLTLAALYGLGTVLAGFYLLYGRDVFAISSALQEPIYFASGMFFPVRSLGAAAGASVSLLPLAMGLDAMRQVMLTGTTPLLPTSVEIIGLCVQVVVYLALAIFALRFIEQMARRRGSIVSRMA